MRIWSLHPRYLDGKGLVALWREGLLAKAVLEGKTRGYVHHSQFARFRAQPDPVGAINAYLHFVLLEGRARNNRFDENKLLPVGKCPLISVTDGQICYEWKHLLAKLKTRDTSRYSSLYSIEVPDAHPLMKVVPGPVEPWEAVR
jgi:hypothetical protein